MSQDPTKKFRQALPFAFLPVSSNLAALHASRASFDPSQSDNPFCPRCGSFYGDGNSHVRIILAKKTRSAKRRRFLHRSCDVCGWQDDIPLKSEKPPLSSPIPPGPSTKANTLEEVKAQAAPTPKSPSATVAASPAKPGTSTYDAAATRSKARPKHKSVLQQMLSRSRKDEQSRSTKASPTDGLAAFLESL